MKILVSGGAGYVGTTLIPMLLARGHQVRTLDNLMYGGEGLLPCFQHRAFEFVKGSVTDRSTLQRALQGMDLAIHLAAIVGYPACKKNPALAQAVNFESTRLLIDLCGKQIPILYASTGSNYGAVVGQLCTEETPLTPLSVYGETKTAAEKALLAAGNCVVYRFATAFGVSPRLRLDLLINDFCYQAKKIRNLIIYEKTYKRTFIHVRDMGRAILFALDNFPRLRGQVYNCGDESLNFSKEEIAKRIKEKTDFYLHFAEVGKDEDQRNYEVSYRKLRDAGFRVEVGLDEGIDELLRVCEVIEVQNPFSNV